MLLCNYSISHDSIIKVQTRCGLDREQFEIHPKRMRRGHANFRKTKDKNKIQRPSITVKTINTYGFNTVEICALKLDFQLSISQF